MRRFVVVLAALLATAAAVLAASGAFRANAAVCPAARSGGKSPFVGDAPPNTLSVSYIRHNGLLRSLAVHARPQTANACTEVEVWGGGQNQPIELVYREQVPMPPLSAWSGTLPTRLWTGGCRVDWHYSLVTLSVPPGASLADLLSEPPSGWGRGDFKAREISGARLKGCRSGASASTH